MTDYTSASNYAQAMIDYAETIRVAGGAEADRLLTSMVMWQANPVGKLQQYSALALRVATLSALCKALSESVPQSSEDAEQMLDTIINLCDNVILDCADAGFDATVDALRTLKSSTVAYLSELVVEQPDMLWIDTQSNLPSVVAAYSLYRDATRCDQLTENNDTLCDLFLPNKLKALSA